MPAKVPVKEEYVVPVRDPMPSLCGHGIPMEVRDQNVTQHPTQNNSNNNSPIKFWGVINTLFKALLPKADPDFMGPESYAI